MTSRNPQSMSPKNLTNPFANPLILWGKRIGIICIALLLTGYSAIDSYSATTRNSSPDFALQINAGDNVALVRLADFQLAVDKDKNVLSRVSQYAKTGLKDQAINSRALRILATVADKQGDAQKAAGLTALSAKTSRRELGTQIWYIDRAAIAGDAKTALKHYDIILRSNPTAPKLLFPALGKALSNVEIRRNFLPFLKSDPVWLWDFLTYAVYNDVDPVAQAQLFLSAGGYPRAAKYREVEKTLVERLYKTSHYFEAELVGQKVFPAGKNARERISLTAQNISVNAAPFQWRTGADIAANSGIELGSPNILQAWAEPGTRALVASKLLALSPGNYVFAGNETLTSGAIGDGSYWQISCLSGKDQQMIWRRHLSSKSSAVNTVSIANGCKFQLLELYLEGGLSSDGARIDVKDLSLHN